MVLEGFLLWSLPPVARRLITRGIAIVPCLVVVSTTGREGLANILNASQVLLSILLPIVSAPLIWFTCSKQIMRVPLFVRDGDEEADLIYDIDDSSSIHLVNTATNGTNRPIRFKSTEPAIRLQDLRKSHPCAGWEEDEDLDNQQQGRPAAVNESGVVYPEEERVDFLNATNSASTTLIGNDTLDNGYRVKGYKDMSNGPITAFFAVFVWGFITCLNLFLIGSMLLGMDVHL